MRETRRAQLRRQQELIRRWKLFLHAFAITLFVVVCLIGIASGT